MKKKTEKPKQGGSSRKAMKHASRRKKANEVRSDQSLKSSLDSDVGLAPVLDDESMTGGQFGDLQGISNVGDADAESVEELLEDGQALEAEVISGVEDARDEKEVPSRGRIESEPSHEYGERNKI